MSWDQQLLEYCVTDASSGGFNCAAAALAPLDSGAIYAAADTAGAGTDDAWAKVYKENYSVKMMQDDGTEQDVAVNEAEFLLAAVNKAKAGDLGAAKFFLGGTRYTVLQAKNPWDDPIDGVEGIETAGITWALCGGPAGSGTGCVLCCSPAQIVIALYDENMDESDGKKRGKVAAQYAGSAALGMAKFMKDQGQ